MTDTTQFSKTLRAWMETFTHRSMRDWSRYVKASGFSMPQFFLLMHLHGRGHCVISEISKHMEISTAAASQLVDKLVQAGLLIRTEDPDDRRARQLALTEAGRDLIEKGVAERYRWVDEVTNRLSDEEKVKVSAALVILTETAHEIDLETTSVKNPRE